MRAVLHVRPMIVRPLIGGLMSLAFAAVATAQCPDGTPPPCAGVRLSATPRRPAPPRDEHAWIVVPFDNIAHSADIDWLRDGSVNLLYEGMSRWKDVRVLDDSRVAQLLHEVAATRGPGPLPIETAIQAARLGGASKLVMGDLVKAGSR